MYKPSLYLLNNSINLDEINKENIDPMSNNNSQKIHKNSTKKLKNPKPKILEKKEKTIVFRKIDINKKRTSPTNLKTIKFKENEFKTNFSFKPKINENSKIIASKLENSFSRWTRSPIKDNLTKNILENSSISNKNKININENSNKSRKQKKFGRENWLLYYKKLSIDNINKKLDEKKVKEELEFKINCIFSPKINKSKSNIKRKEFHQRISHWNNAKCKKLEKIKKEINNKIKKSCEKRNYYKSFKNSPLPKNLSKNNPTSKSILKYLEKRKIIFKEKSIKKELDKKYKII